MHVCPSCKIVFSPTTSFDLGKGVVKKILGS